MIKYILPLINYFQNFSMFSANDIVHNIALKYYAGKRKIRLMQVVICRSLFRVLLKSVMDFFSAKIVNAIENFRKKL